MATDSGKEMGYKGYDPGFGGDTAAFNELVDSVDFPKFVADLLKAVFDANLKVMKKQTDTYIKLMKEATKSTADFIKKVKDDETLRQARRVAAATSTTSPPRRQPDGTTKLALTNPEGDKVDPEDAEVKRHILEAKINMAKEHRAALREVLLMGVTRLVVKKGVIEAGVEFSVKATRESKAHHDDQNINVASMHTEYESPLGGLFGGPSGSLDVHEHEHPGQHVGQEGDRRPVGDAQGQGQHRVQDRLLQARQLREHVRRRRRCGPQARRAGRRRAGTSRRRRSGALRHDPMALAILELRRPGRVVSTLPDRHRHQPVVHDPVRAWGHGSGGLCADRRCRGRDAAAPQREGGRCSTPA